MNRNALFKFQESKNNYTGHYLSIISKGKETE